MSGGRVCLVSQHSLLTKHRSTVAANWKIPGMKEWRKCRGFERPSWESSELSSYSPVPAGREVFCVTLELRPTTLHTSETPEHSHVEPECVRITDSQDGWSSQRCWPCMLGATQITYYFSVHYLEPRSHCIDTGTLCICLPALSL